MCLCRELSKCRAALCCAQEQGDEAKQLSHLAALCPTLSESLSRNLWETLGSGKTAVSNQKSSKTNPKHMKISIFGKRVSLSFNEKRLISVKRKKKQKQKTYHIKKTQPSDHEQMHSQIDTSSDTHWHPNTSCYTPTPTEALTHKHMYALFTHPRCSHPTDANTHPETHSLILGTHIQTVFPLPP